MKPRSRNPSDHCGSPDEALVAGPPRRETAYDLAIPVVPVLFASAANPLVSTPRFVLAAFPLFIVLGATLLENRKVLAGWLLLSVAASLPFTALFVGWYFVA
jgi:hypothetical protein